MPPDKPSANYTSLLLLLPLLLALAGTWGSLYLSIGMGLKACPLCFYQRTFVMAGLAVLVMGWLADRTQGGLFSLLCVPLAVGGLGVAAFHEYLVLTGKLECPLGLLGLGTAPAQSLATLAALAVTVAWCARPKLAWVPGGVLLGLVLAWGCVASAPPLPPAPTEPYKQPLDVCRPPYRGG
jgi:disulfide bond formation protein DsbB